jgi:hypothetical protein
VTHQEKQRCSKGDDKFAQSARMQSSTMVLLSFHGVEGPRHRQWIQTFPCFDVLIIVASCMLSWELKHTVKHCKPFYYLSSGMLGGIRIRGQFLTHKRRKSDHMFLTIIAAIIHFLPLLKVELHTAILIRGACGTRVVSTNQSHFYASMERPDECLGILSCGVRSQIPYWRDRWINMDWN